MEREELLSLNDAANRKAVPVTVLRRAIEAGELPAVEQGGASFLRPADLDRWEPHVKTAAGADYTAEEANTEFYEKSSRA